MAWTAPRTWVVGELVTAAIMNTHIRDNQIYLKTQTDLLYTVTHAAPARALDTIYQNSTKIRIVLIGMGFTAADDENVTLQIGAGTPPATQVGIMRNDSNNIIQMTGTIVVPPSWYYRVVSAAGPTLIDWEEWDFF